MSKILCGLLASMMLVGSAFAEPPEGFLDACKGESKLAIRILSEGLSSEKSPALKKKMATRIAAIRKGELVAPPIARFFPGEIGRDPDSDLRRGNLTIIKELLDSERAILKINVGSGLDPKPEFKEVVVVGNDYCSLQKMKSGSSMVGYLELPPCIEVLEPINGIPAITPFDLQAWAKAQKKK